MPMMLEQMAKPVAAHGAGSIVVNTGIPMAARPTSTVAIFTAT